MFNKIKKYALATVAALTLSASALPATAQTVEDTGGVIAGQLSGLYGSAASTTIDWVFTIVASVLILMLVVAVIRYASRMIGASRAS